MSKVVAIAGSAGACTAMREILSALPADFPSPILYLQHMNSSHLATLAGRFQYSRALKVRCARRDECLTEGVVYVCSPGSDCTIRRDNSNALAHTVSFRTIDHFLASVAAVHEQRLVAVLLSGGGSDGAAGIRVVHATHGTGMRERWKPNRHSRRD